MLHCSLLYFTFRLGSILNWQDAPWGFELNNFLQSRIFIKMQHGAVPQLPHVEGGYMIANCLFISGISYFNYCTWCLLSLDYRHHKTKGVCLLLITMIVSNSGAKSTRWARVKGVIGGSALNIDRDKQCKLGFWSGYSHLRFLTCIIALIERETRHKEFILHFTHYQVVSVNSTQHLGANLQS